VSYLFTAKRNLRIPADNKYIFKLFSIFIAISIYSYLFMLLFTLVNSYIDLEDFKPVNFGLFQLYRWIQFISIFLIISALPLNQSRIKTLRAITLFVLIFVSLSAILTQLNVVTPSVFSSHLPNSLDISGPWYYYINSLGTGRGSIGYNHSYIAIQIILSLALFLHFNRYRSNSSLFLHLFGILLACIAVFFSGSRTGLITILIYSLSQFRGILTQYLLLLLSLIMAALVFSQPHLFSTDEDTTYIIVRQLTVLDPAQNLSGRDGIWLNYIDHLNSNPIRWFIGSGTGSNIQLTSNAHNLYLNIIAEGGLPLFISFVVIFTAILRILWKNERSPKSVFFVTLALLISSLTQETFYPVPALGHFLGFYLFALAIALRSPHDLDRLASLQR
jgi:O-antigen ligase